MNESGSNDIKHIANAATLESQDFNTLLHVIGTKKDKQAFLQLFDYFAPRIKSYLLKAGMSEDEADELAQDTMVMVWQKAEQYNPERAGASTWIFTIARNKRIDYLRKHSRMSAQPPEKFNDIKADSKSPFEEFYHHEMSAGIEEAMGALSPDQIDIIQKAFFEDKPHSQIAKETGLPLGTVKSRIRLAMEKLRKSMEDQNKKNAGVSEYRMN